MLANDTGAPVEWLTAVWVGGGDVPPGAELILNPDGSLSFGSGDSFYAGETITLTYYATDGTDVSNVATITLVYDGGGAGMAFDFGDDDDGDNGVFVG